MFKATIEKWSRIIGILTTVGLWTSVSIGVNLLASLYGQDPQFTQPHRTATVLFFFFK